jgi:glycerol-3-phosphate acyltransferase PlsY
MFEVRRKFIHLIPLLIPLVSTFDILKKQELIIVAGISTLIAFSLDIARMRRGFVSKVFFQLFGSLLRPSEKRTFTGSSYYLLGIFLALLIFPKPIAEASMFILIIGDTMAAFVGTMWGRTKIWGKSLEGSLAFLVSSCAILALLGRVGMHVAVVGALVATVVELLPLSINDNLTIPISSGVSMYLVSYLF